MLAYRYDSETKEYKGIQQAQADPLAGGYLLPANCTFVEVPEYTTGTIPVFKNDSWTVQNDYRGQYQVKLADLTFKKVDYIGNPPTGYQIVSEEVYDNYLEDPDRYKVIDGVFTDIINTPEYEAIKAEEREEGFKAKFFYIEDFGWYRKQPKGYQSAVESMNVLLNIANLTDGIQAGLIIFYQQPDYTKPEECTEEWLVQHQIILPAMSKAEFMALYVAFMTAWNTEEH
jgi:hypothetical protein